MIVSGGHAFVLPAERDARDRGADGPGPRCPRILRGIGVRLVYETHSTSVHNEEGVATGWLAGALSEIGREQAESLGRRRRNDGLDVVIASDLNRAVETARIALAGSSVPVLLDWRLRECDYGEMNGMPRSLLDEERRARLDKPFPGGESWRQAIARATGLLDELTRTRGDQTVCLIGHVATRWALEHVVDGVRLGDLVDAPFVLAGGLGVHPDRAARRCERRRPRSAQLRQR